MNRNTLMLFCCLMMVSLYSFAQPNVFTGTWQMEYSPGAGKPAIHVTLQVGSPDKNLLYPAHLVLESDGFHGSYDLLLAKRNSRVLAISRNKYPEEETPFSLGNGLFFLNGTFDMSRDLKGALTLHHIRLLANENIEIFADSLRLQKEQKTIAVNLLRFLGAADIRLTKINEQGSNIVNSEAILNPTVSPAYFGLQDSFYLPTRDGTLHLSSIKKSDIVSVTLNGSTLIDLQAVSKKDYTEDVLLDTGMNVILLFADNFGDQLPNKGSLQLDIANRKIDLDFGSRRDSGAGFIAAKIYVDPKTEKENTFREYPVSKADKMGSNDKLIGSIVAVSRQVKLAIWDDAVEDGDSISISINNTWIARGLPVKKQPHFITVTLKPGPNTINFMADNLGLIPPNTSVLEIIDGNKRKSYNLETVLGENNLVRIFYDNK